MPTWPQPREGIAGTDRSADRLLSLEDDAIAARLVIGNLTVQLQSALLMGVAGATRAAESWQRMKEPQVGDYVLEWSTWRRNTSNFEGDWYRGFGVLVAHRKEWWQTDAEWTALVEEEGEDRLGDRMTDDAWYVQYGPAPTDVCRWVNCMFIRVPTGLEVTPA